MPEEKLRAVKESIETAHAATSEIVAKVVSTDSNEILKQLSDSQCTISQSNNEPSPESELVRLCSAMVGICQAIKILALSPDLAQVNVRGVSFMSIITDLNEAATVAKRTETFAKMSLNDALNDEDLKQIDCILGVSNTTEKCANLFSNILEQYNRIETTIELSNALKIVCSAIKCCASKVALKYAWGNDCICEEN